MLMTQQPAKLCAHRGLNRIAPENTLPAFDAVLAHGGTEIELDLWPARDGTLIVCHDATVDRTTDGSGPIAAMDYAALCQLDAGVRFSDAFRGTRLPRFEEVLERYGNGAIINLHIKSAGQPRTQNEAMLARKARQTKAYRENKPFANLVLAAEEPILQEIEERVVAPYPPDVFERIVNLLSKYGCLDSVYITGERDVLTTALALAPELPRNCLEGHLNYSIVAHALRFGCKRLQFNKLFLTKAMIDQAHAHGLHCNLFWSDDPDEGRGYLALGIDTLLTNDYAVMAEALGLA